MSKQQKRAYLRICMEQPTAWLIGSCAEPSKYMRPIHVTLARIAIRRKL